MYLNIALPKGRLGDNSYQLLKSLGYECPEYEQKSRKLIINNKENQIRIYLVKASDVPIYVERGVADVGFVGSDILQENQGDVLEMLDLQYGKCRFALASKAGFVDDGVSKLIVATKYINIANEYFAKQNREIELVKLNGSVELGPLVDLADVIVDLVETGTTLKENNLKIIDDICDVSARFIVNEANYRFKTDIIENLLQRLRKAVNYD